MSAIYMKSLLGRFKNGDIQAFNKVYLLYSDRLYSFSLGLLKDPHKSQEVVQEVFITLWEKKDQINTDLNFENYLFTITHNSIKKVFRKRLIEIKVKEQLAHNKKNSKVNLENEMIYNDLLVIAEKSIEKLPAKRKQVYKMSRQQGLKIREIANKLKISTRTVECHLSKALKFLKKEINNDLLHLNE